MESRVQRVSHDRKNGSQRLLDRKRSREEKQEGGREASLEDESSGWFFGFRRSLSYRAGTMEFLKYERNAVFHVAELHCSEMDIEVFDRRHPTEFSIVLRWETFEEAFEKRLLK